MDYKFWLDLSRIVGITGAFFALLAGAGVLYFGNKVAKLNEKEIATLKSENTNLKQKMKVSEKQIKEQKKEVKDLREYSKEEITSLKDENLTLKESVEISQNEIEKQKEEVEAIRDYSDMSVMNLYGGKHTFPGKTGTLIEGGPLINTMKKVFITKGDKTDVIYSDKAILAAKKAIEIQPRFPFSYFALAMQLKAKNEIKNGDKEEWKFYANKSIEIFEKTTKIKGHSDHHDQALASLKKMVNKN